MSLSDYQLFYNDFGKLQAIANNHGYQLKFNSETKAFDETDPLTKQLRSLEAETGKSLDLSDLPYIDSLSELKTKKQQQLVEWAKHEQEALVADYSPAEQASWDRKVAESQKILVSNNLSDAPIIKTEAIAFSGAQTEVDILAATLNLAQVIVYKSELLYLASAEIAGRRSRLWNQIEAAATIEELFLIVWETK